MSDELKASAGPGGLTVESRGPQTTNILLAIAVCAWVWYVNFNQDSKAADNAKVQVVATERLAKAIEGQTRAIEKIAKGQRVQAYILTLSPKERERLRLAEPDELRELQRER